MTIYEHAGKKYRLADQRDIGKVINGSDICFEKAMQNSVDTLVEYLPHKTLGRYIGRDCRTGGGYEWKFAYVELTKEELQDLYTERQAAWVAENDVKPGTKVRVTRTAKSYEDGWEDNWIDRMDKYVGKELTVNRTDGSSMHLLTVDDAYCWNFPYFVLEVVKEPLPAAQAEVPPPPAGYEVVPESEYASYMLRRGDYFLGGCSNKWIPLRDTVGYTCADLRNQWPTSHQLYTGFARRIPVVAERPKVEETPDLWRLLGDDEIVQEGDLINSTQNKWRPESLKQQNPVRALDDGWLSATGIGKPVSDWKGRVWVIRRIDAESKQTESERVLNSLCESIHAKNVKAGWWDAKDNLLVVPTKLALIHSEVSEALEGHRKGLKDDKLPEYDMVAVELADVLIRVFDLAGFLNIPLGTIIEAKERYNAQRADHKPENRKAVGGKRY